MVDSIASNSASSLISALMQQKTTAQNIGIAVLEKGRDIQQQQAEAVLKLIDASASAAALGRIDEYI